MLALRTSMLLLHLRLSSVSPWRIVETKPISLISLREQSDTNACMSKNCRCQKRQSSARLKRASGGRVSAFGPTPSFNRINTSRLHQWILSHSQCSCFVLSVPSLPFLVTATIGHFSRKKSGHRIIHLSNTSLSEKLARRTL